MNEKVLVACIGNIFLGDDGFGFEVAQALAGCPPPKGVEVRDYGIRGLDLAYALLCPWRAVLLVDAIQRGAAPGTVYLLQPEEVKPASHMPLDPHAMDPLRVLATARSLGEIRAAIYIVGCEPEDLGDETEGRMGLSPAVAAAVPEAVKMVLRVAEKLVSETVTHLATSTGGKR
ncbi:MAG TPA: hydrogenase maturation protease [Acidobacteriaceae bacterium]|jgi:hydrogenase maturation protease|nr:hydrogenase maturation protease [Acidobacteriaceae bacterium]